MKNLIKIYKAIKKVVPDFPTDCETGNELDWVFKGNCPCCVANPWEEHNSILEYRLKYPVTREIIFDSVKIQLCEEHFNQLVKYFKEYNKDGE